MARAHDPANISVPLSKPAQHARLRTTVPKPARNPESRGVKLAGMATHGEDQYSLAFACLLQEDEALQAGDPIEARGQGSIGERCERKMRGGGHTPQQ